jgi:cytochrome c biogenesis protein
MIFKEKNDSFTGRIWKLFASISLAVTLFGLISLVSVIGTVIPQKPDQAIKFLNTVVGVSSAPTVYNFLIRIHLIDMYQSWWFISLLFLFSANITVCTIDRLPGVLRIIKGPVGPLGEERIRKMPIERSLIFEGVPVDVKDAVSIAFKKAGFDIKEVREEKGYQLYSQKGGWSRLGGYITHISILVILIGAIIGLSFGQESYLSLPEGDISSVAYPIPYSGKKEPIPLGFEIRCDNFEVDFYDRTTKPRLFKSQVTIMENGKEVLKKTITVNDPLTYRGTKFYLSDYGVFTRRLSFSIFIFRVTSKDGQSSEVRLGKGGILRIPNSSITGKIVNFIPAVILDQSGGLTAYETDELLNPAVQIEFSESGKKPYSVWIYKRFPETSLLPDGNRVEFLDLWGVEYTFFRIRKDPGAWLVYTGMITLGIGMVVAFFMSHRKIWVSLIEVKANTRVVVGATANKNRGAFEREIDGIIRKLEKRRETIGSDAPL